MSKPLTTIVALIGLAALAGCKGTEDNPYEKSAKEFLEDWRAKPGSHKHYEVTGRACYHLGGYICPMHFKDGMDCGPDGKESSCSWSDDRGISCYKIDKKMEGKKVVVRGQMGSTAPGNPELSGCDIVD